MYLGIDFIVEFLIGLVIGCLLWVFREYLFSGAILKRLHDIQMDRKREKAQEYLVKMDQYQQLIKQQAYWMKRDWLEQKLKEEAAYEQKTRR